MKTATVTALLIAIMASISIAQEIVGATNVATCEPVWLALDLPDGSTGKFDDGAPGYRLYTDPEHVVTGSAMFFATQPGTYRVVAAYVSDGKVAFLEHTITVKEDGPTPPGLKLTSENVLAWVELVPLEVRNERITNPVTEKTMTRQQAVGKTYTNIGKAGEQVASVDGMDLLLSTALVSALGDTATKWRPLAEKLDGRLQVLKDNGVSAAEYAEALLIIGGALSDE